MSTPTIFYCQLKEKTELSLFLQRKRRCLLQVLCSNMTYLFTRLCRCQGSLSSPSQKLIMQVSVKVTYASISAFPRAHYHNITYYLHCETSGFTCGEAVNFAIGEWFPLGAEASQRYSHLCRMPIIPYEELLCKEAMLLCNSHEHGDSAHSTADSASKNCVKLSFVRLIQSHHNALQFLQKVKGSSISSSPNSRGTILCSLCKRDCFLAYINCSCHSHPICIFHGTRSITWVFLLSRVVFHWIWKLSTLISLGTEIEALNCPCGNNPILFLREDASEMEEIAKKFEQEVHRYKDDTYLRKKETTLKASKQLV